MRNELFSFLIVAACATTILSGCKKADDEPNSTAGYDCLLGTCESVSDNATYPTLNACQNDCEIRDAQIVVYLKEDCYSGNVEAHDPYGVTNYILTGYYPTASPDCGGAGAATFNVKSGTVNVFVSSPLQNWDENITVAANTCTKIRLNCDGTITKTTTTSSPNGGYNCSGGSCSYSAGGGTYSSLSACQSACGGSGVLCNFVGTWKKPVNCGNGSGTVTLNADGTGSWRVTSCDGACIDEGYGLKWKTDGGTSFPFSLQILYGGWNQCSNSGPWTSGNPLYGDNWVFSCSQNEICVNSVCWIRL
jgi:hypothetical protein